MLRQYGDEMSEVEKLRKRLEAMNCKSFHVTRGEQPSTPEQLAAEVNRCLDRMERGELKEVFDIEYGLEFETQGQCWEFYKLNPMPKWSEYTGVAWQLEVEAYEKSLPERFKAFMESK